MKRRHFVIAVALPLLACLSGSTVRESALQAQESGPQSSPGEMDQDLAAQPTPAPSTQPNADLDLHIDEFGINEGEPIDRGFVFFDGRYLDSPYFVRRVGLAIFINDCMIQRPFAWPSPYPDESKVGLVDPELPDTVNAATPKDDPAVSYYIGEKAAYIRKHYPRDEAAMRRFAEACERLPNVLKTEYASVASNALRVYWADGSSHKIGLWPLERKSIIQDIYKNNDKPAMLDYIESMRKSFEDSIKDGVCYFFYSKHGRTSMGEVTAAQVLPVFVDIMRSDRTVSDKFEALKQNGWNSMILQSKPELVENFSASPQLDRRVSELVRKYQRKSEPDRAGDVEGPRQ